MIYFDNAASTKPDLDILEKYRQINEELYANPSSLNNFSKHCEHLFNQTKHQILSSLNLKNDYDVIFTSGASESNSLAIIGYVIKNIKKGDNIIVSEVEHASILNASKYLSEKYKIKVSYLKIKSDGQYDVEHFKTLINKKTILVSLMLVNNEIGTIYDMSKIKEILKEYPDVIFHSDAVQAIGKINYDYNLFDMFTLSGHKIHSMKGQGALILKKNLQLSPLIFGGNQQENIRSGTLDLANAYCLNLAIKKAIKEIDIHQKNVQLIHDKIFKYLKNNGDLYELNSKIDDLCYILNFSFKHKKASVMCEALSLKGIQTTTVSACSSHVDSSSYVVKALGKNESIYKNTLRISFSKYNTLKEADEFIDALETLNMEIKDER